MPFAEHKQVMQLIGRIRKPISYACGDSFSRLGSIKNLGQFVAAQIRSGLRLEMGRTFTIRLEALLGQFSDYDRQPPDEQKKRLVFATGMIEEMMVEAGRPVPQGETDPSPVPPDPNPRHEPSPTMIPWGMEIRYVKGVGSNRAESLKKLGVHTLEGLLYFVPWRYEDRSHLKKIADLTPGEAHTLSAKVLSTRIEVTRKKKLQIFEALISDETGSLPVKWFNQPYLKSVLKRGQHLMLSGKVRVNPYGGRLEMENPQFEIQGSEGADELRSEEELLHTGRITPIYHETRGFSSRMIRTLIKSVLDTWGPSIGEVLPRRVLERHGLPGLGESLSNIHFPGREEQVEAFNHGESRFHRRLVFDDFFLLQLGLAFKRREVAEERQGIAFRADGAGINRFLEGLPFTLTVAQRRVIGEIQRDMAASRPMNRLLQGDVGCGKTLVALIALLIAIENGYQGVLMAPTEILAEQHYLTVRGWLSGHGLNVSLLTSGMPRNDRMAVQTGIEKGKVHLAVGTHALIQEGVRFQRLGMVVIDEQHKFGVLQRADLVKKGYHPDVLIMTATPIPRTLALSVYGDMDVSVIDELPPGRSPVKTILLDERLRPRAYEIIVSDLERGRQGFIVYPLVEESEKSDLRAATQMAKYLQDEIFPQWRLGLLHGQMKTEEKEAVMNRFKNHEIDLLVATSVVEVGIDVPNATMILIEHAERFGLAQLHQLRGRVGRGKQDSSCILMAGASLTEEGRRRLEVMVQYRDGFSISEQDLVQRGPGEFFGTRQSGLPELKVANLIRDQKILETARREAFDLIKEDPLLGQPRHASLRQSLLRRWKHKLEFMTIS